ncbi:hypothetical protein Fot_47723 [Forsythia ovata]|uniref:Uncharacterized protein n=1 Tax=Forsythia ovata TaxID=205694 RepID=A0ABD1QS27_9LAMI
MAFFTAELVVSARRSVDLEREWAAHSEEAGPQREESHRRQRLGLQWWEFQREEGPPRGDPQLDWGVHSEGSRPKARERSPPVAMAFSGGGFGVRRRSRWGGGFLGHEMGIYRVGDEGDGNGRLWGGC